jgi:co-chaperonin GroES (HSP10)
MKAKRYTVGVISDYILIKMKTQQQDDSGFIHYQSDECNQSIGTVIETGSAVSSEIVVDMDVVINVYSGTQLTIDGEIYKVIKEEDVLLTMIKIKSDDQH